MLSPWKLQVPFAGSRRADAPPQRREKVIPGKEWKGMSYFGLFLLPAWQGLEQGESQTPSCLPLVQTKPTPSPCDAA